MKSFDLLQHLEAELKRKKGGMETDFRKPAQSLLIPTQRIKPKIRMNAINARKMASVCCVSSNHIAAINYNLEIEKTNIRMKAQLVLCYIGTECVLWPLRRQIFNFPCVFWIQNIGVNKNEVKSMRNK